MKPDRTIRFHCGDCQAVFDLCVDPAWAAEVAADLARPRPAVHDFPGSRQTAQVPWTSFLTPLRQKIQEKAVTFSAAGED
jgi:hypothetical protein